MGLLRRSTTYYSRAFVPADLAPVLRRSEILKSLRTRRAREARLRASMWEGHLAHLFAQLRRDHRDMDRDAIDALVAEYLRHRFDDAEANLATTSDPVAREARAADVNWELHRIEQQLADGDHRATDAAAAELAPGASEDVRAILARRLLEANFTALLAELRGYSGVPLQRPTTTTPAPSKPASRVTVSELIDKYRDFHLEGGAWSPSTATSVKDSLRVLVAVVGNKPVSQVTKDDMRAFRSTLSRLPSNASKRYPKLSLLEAADAADAANDDRRLSPKTKNLHMSWVQSLWRWAVVHDYANENPTVVLSAFDEEDARDAREVFTPAEVAAILAKLEEDRETMPALPWIARVMFTTGARLEEVTKLRVRDVRQQDGVWVYDFNEDVGRLKNKQSARLVPVHSQLLDELLAWRTAVEAKSGADANLWGLTRDADAPRWSKEVSRLLNRRIDAAGIQSRKKVMESSRNTFQTALARADVPLATIGDIVGHKGGMTDVQRRYIKQSDLRRMAAAVEKYRLPEHRAS